MTTATLPVGVVQGKYGYHPCTKETYLKLKYIHKYFQQALRDVANWHRWNNKLPHNRVRRWIRKNGKKERLGVPIPWQEPKVCEFFAKKKETKYGTYTITTMEWNPDVQKLLTAYCNARYPQAEPEKVVSLGISLDMVNKAYDLVQAANIEMEI